jgi:hypothetical protein
VKLTPWTDQDLIDQPRKKLKEVISDIKEEWLDLQENSSRIEIKELLAETVSMMEAKEREMAGGPNRNVELESFHDTRATLAKVSLLVRCLCLSFNICLKEGGLQLDELHGRQGVQSMVLASRSKFNQVIHPFAFFSSETVGNFITLSLKVPQGDIANQFEAFMLSGIKSKVAHT